VNYVKTAESIDMPFEVVSGGYPQGMMYKMGSRFPVGRGKFLKEKWGGAVLCIGRMQYQQV